MRKYLVNLKFLNKAMKDFWGYPEEEFAKVYSTEMHKCEFSVKIAMFCIKRYKNLFGKI